MQTHGHWRDDPRMPAILPTKLSFGALPVLCLRQMRVLHVECGVDGGASCHLPAAFHTASETAAICASAAIATTDDGAAH